MATLSALPEVAQVPLPPWMWGGKPAGLLQAAGLHARRDSAGADTWLVRTEERYRRQSRPGLFVVEHLAGPGAGTPRWRRLTEAAEAAAVEDPGRLAPEHRLQARIDHAAATGGLLEHLAAAHLLTLDAGPEALADTVARTHQALTVVELAERPGERPLRNAGVHLFRRSAQVVHRVKLTAALLQLEHDPQLREGDVAALAAAHGGDLLLRASGDLCDGVILLDAYLGPLLGALTPYVWAMSTPRALGTIIYSLGAPLQGTSSEPTELLHLLPVQGAERIIPAPTTPVGAPAAALQWWADRLDALFGVLTDPAIFTDPHQHYQPSAHLHALLTVEQLFRRVHSLQLAHRDATARRALLFTALDTVERLTGDQIDRLCSRRRAQEILDELEQRVPVDAGAILLPAARRAVDALTGAQQGLYLLDRTGESTIRVQAGNGLPRMLDRNAAIGEYLKVRRDATHGHGAHKTQRKPITDTLLAHHTGALPHDLGLLAYLHLLDLLCHPEPLARRLHTDARRG